MSDEQPSDSQQVINPPPLPPRPGTGSTREPQRATDQKASGAVSPSPSDLAAWQRKLEDEEIERYLADFTKHVDHLRVVMPTEHPTLARPLLGDYTFQALEARKGAARECQSGDDAPATIETDTNVSAVSPDAPKEGFGPWLSSVDWMAYAAAYLRFLVGPPTPLAPVEPFSVARLRSNGERLYTVAAPAWSAFARTVGDICLWRNKLRTSAVVAVYTVLVLTSTLLPVLPLLPLYPLLARRLKPPSPLKQYQDAAAARQETQDVADLADELAADARDVSTRDRLGVRLDLGQAKDLLDASGISGELPVKDKAKRGRLRRKIQSLENEYGAGMVVVLGDLADLHEKVKNLYLWRSRRSANTFITLLVTASLASYLCPLWILVKLVQIAIGVVAFVVVPLIAGQERYEPMAWMAGSAPTDAEYAVLLLRQRAVNGEPLLADRKVPLRVATQAPSDDTASAFGSDLSYAFDLEPSVAKPAPTVREKVVALGQRGVGLLETTRKLASGEDQFKLSFAASGAQSSAVTPDGQHVHQISLGNRVPRIVLSKTKGNAETRTGRTSTYFAQYGRSAGNLRISTESISFRPLIPSKVKVEPSSPETRGPVEGNQDAAPHATKAKMSLVKNGEVDILMRDVIGVRRRDKTSLFVVISAGLEIECAGGRIVTFAFVAERDSAFSTILALSDRSFTRV